MSALRDLAVGKKRPPTVTEGPALWRGEIVDVLSSGLVWVLIPRMGGQDPIGPINAAPSGLVPGDRVVVGAVGRDMSDLLVLSLAAAPAPVPPSWEGVTGKPVVFPPSAHTHDWATGVTGKPATFVPSAHTHVVADITNFPTLMPPTAHTHDAGDIPSGVFAPARLPLVTVTTDGAMPKADKIKLDGATATNTANTIVQRDASGNVRVAAVSLDSATTLFDHAARKDYVDAGDAGRALLVHRHTYADIDGQVPTSALPSLAINDTFAVSSQAAMLALVAERGDMCIRTDIGRTFVLSADTPTVLGAWLEMMAAGQVTSVNYKTGAVQITQNDVGLGVVDNTRDMDKPISYAVDTALSGKAPIVHGHADATISVTGFMPSTDKAKLNAATPNATANALMFRDTSGRAKIATPSAATDIANKAYVDDAEAYRLSWSALTGWDLIGGLIIHPLSSGNFGISVDLSVIRTGGTVNLTTGWTVLGKIVPSVAIDSAIGIHYFPVFSTAGHVYAYINFGNGDFGMRGVSGAVDVGLNSTTSFSGAAVRAA